MSSRQRRGKKLGEEIGYCPYCGGRLRDNISMKMVELRINELRHYESISMALLGMGVALLLTYIKVTYGVGALMLINIGLITMVSGFALVIHFLRKRLKLMRLVENLLELRELMEKVKENRYGAFAEQ